MTTAPLREVLLPSAEDRHRALDNKDSSLREVQVAGTSDHGEDPVAVMDAEDGRLHPRPYQDNKLSDGTARRRPRSLRHHPQDSSNLLRVSVSVLIVGDFMRLGKIALPGASLVFIVGTSIIFKACARVPTGTYCKFSLGGCIHLA